MKFPRRTLEDPAINLTPLIDVVFLLLIFFMVTTTFTRETRIAVNLPEANAEQAEAVPNQIEVLVSQSGRYSVNDQVLSDTQLMTLGRALIDAAAGDRSTPVLLIADAEATHQSVVTAMDAIGQSGFSRLSIATRRADDESDTDGGATP
ncbi:ExbD/TolR family protein [Pseudohongiella sp.]|uniref:Biopolymer transport protein ExbD/TolR n=1 Tax=marine sediment metagenome TaxID=412755 RepID=A0A0F9YHP5_9ZZZZ|nr:biopolymer transporter ExbD [Pseudohongiella sp.]HDZ09019.1 biopolymer transporter ExbD [Pseudohongiella sp.]HEA62704.1 biopolymer transporter ExbD [Pseudohongiella sp.]